MLGAGMQLARMCDTRALWEFLFGVCMAFAVGLLFAHLVLGQAWGHARRGGFDAMFAVVIAAIIKPLGRAAFRALLIHAQRNDSQ
jgi:threonine/homoserine efflux transporter RhtA